MRHLLIKDLLWQLKISAGDIKLQKGREYVEWIGSDAVSIVNEFVQKNKLLESYFIRGMNTVFKTRRFETLLKKWILEYLDRFFFILYSHAASQSQSNDTLFLDDISLNRFAAEKYLSRFGKLPRIKWNRRHGLAQKIFSVSARCPVTLFRSLDKGLKVSVRKKRYKVMREALWGLYDIGGYYFHDDFLVDGDKIKKEDILLFTRQSIERGRLKGWQDAKRSTYEHFVLSSLPITINVLFSRIIPKYIISAALLLFREISSPNFLLFWSVYLFFINNALLYEKVFSHFEVKSELGHNYFSANHIAEAIVCQNYGTIYYLMHWSDFSLPVIKGSLFFLGCDSFFTWGKVHIQGVEGNPKLFTFTGYVFKKFIREVASNKDKVLSDMGISAKGKIITFFDEGFGGASEMSEEHYVTFWETGLRLAEAEKKNTILIKPKGLHLHERLSDYLKERFIEIKTQLDRLENVYIVDYNKWSFIEAIGVSDIVVTQGMTSSATIAMVCGIEGLYLDEFGYDHPFSNLFKDRIVFNDPDRLIDAIRRMIKEEDSVFKNVPERLLREFDEYPDDRGIDLFRDILSGSMEMCGL